MSVYYIAGNMVCLRTATEFKNEKRQHQDFQKGKQSDLWDWLVAALVLRPLQLPKTIQKSARDPRKQAAAGAAADALLIFSGHWRSRHTPGLAGTGLARPRPAGARPLTLFGFTTR